MQEGRRYASVIEWNECSLGGNPGSNHESSLLQNALCHTHALTMLCIVTPCFATVSTGQGEQRCLLGERVRTRENGVAEEGNLGKEPAAPGRC